MDICRIKLKLTYNLHESNLLEKITNINQFLVHFFL